MTTSNTNKSPLVSYKTAKTIKEYKITKFGYDLVIPVGSMVDNMTTMGNDDNSHFWYDFTKIAKKLTGFDNSTLFHDLVHYGVDIPSEYCEMYIAKYKPFQGFV